MIEVQDILKQFKFLFQISAIALITIGDSILVLFNTTFRPKKYNFRKHYHNWAARILRVCSIKIIVEGEENFKAGETYVLAANHSSQFDIPILFKAIKPEFRIIYKKELEKIPLFGYQLKKSSFISIDRRDPRKSMKSMKDAVEFIKQNVNVLIFPEGTRSPDGNVQPFKRGAFMLASMSGKPIIPITVIGSSEIMPRGSLYFVPRDVKVIIHSPYYYSDNMTKAQEQELMENIRKTIIDGFENEKKHLHNSEI